MHDAIVIDPNICHGKPVLRGTRMPVSLIVGSLAGGMGFEEVEREYSLTRAQIRAALNLPVNWWTRRNTTRWVLLRNDAMTAGEPDLVGICEQGGIACAVDRLCGGSRVLASPITSAWVKTLPDQGLHQGRCHWLHPPVRLVAKSDGECAETNVPLTHE